MKQKITRRKLSFLQILTAIERDLIVGGQAVMEGVMMRTPSAYAIACRKKDGTIVTTAESLPRWSDTHKWLNLPVLRGGATLIQSMALGIKALNFSASVAHEDMEAEEERVKATQLQTEAAFVEGTTAGHWRAAIGRYTRATKLSDRAMTPTAGSPPRRRARMAGPRA